MCAVDNTREHSRNRWVYLANKWLLWGRGEGVDLDLDRVLMKFLINVRVNIGGHFILIWIAWLTHSSTIEWQRDDELSEIGVVTFIIIICKLFFSDASPYIWKLLLLVAWGVASTCFIYTYIYINIHTWQSKWSLIMLRKDGRILYAMHPCPSSKSKISPKVGCNEQNEWLSMEK